MKTYERKLQKIKIPNNDSEPYVEDWDRRHGFVESHERTFRCLPLQKPTTLNNNKL